MAKFFIDRPVFAWVIAIMMMLGGGLCIKLLAVEQYPDIAPPAVTVTATYPGADAQTIENTVTQLMEQSLTGLDNLIYMKSVSSAQGVVITTLTFAPGTSPNFAQTQVQNKIESIKSRLPESVQKNGVSIAKKNSSFLKVIGFYSTNPQKTQADIADFIYSTVQDPIGRVQGVGDTQLFGSEYAMRIWLDPNKLTYFNLSVEEVIAAIKSQNAQVTAGQLGALPTSEGQELNAIITAQSRLKTTEQFQNILVRVNTDGSNILLKDIAKVEIGASDYNFISYFGDKVSAGLGVYLATGANQLETSDQVDKEIAKLSEIFPEDIRYEYPYDTTPFVKLSINNVVHTLIEAIILVVIVMYVFLQNLRSTLIPTITVPVVLLGTFAVLYVCGFTINTLSMFAMVLAIGLLVDDAIVVIENVERIMHDEGLSPYDATVKSMEQITSALVGIAVVLSAVFVPMAFYGGAAGGIYRQFSITIVTAMGLSVLMAIILTPALCVQILKAPSKYRNQKATLGEKLALMPPFTWCTAFTKRFFNWFNQFYDKNLRLYEKGVIKVIRKPIIAFVCYALILVGLLFGFNRLPTAFLPNEDQGVFLIMTELPPGATIEQSVAVLKKVSNFYTEKASDSVDEIFTIAGFNFIGRGQNMGMGFVRLKDWGERKRADQKVNALINKGQEFAKTITEGRVIIANLSPVPSLGSANGFSYVLKDAAGHGHDALVAAFFQMFGQASHHPKLQQVRPGSMLDVPQYKINVDFEAAQALGVSINSINSVLSTALGSAYIDDFVYNSRVKKVYLQSDAPYRMLPDDFSYWHVKNKNGEMVPYDAFATTTKSYGSPSLVRYDGVGAMEISGSAAPGLSSGQAMAVMEELSKNLPKGFTFDWTEMSYQERQTGSQTTTLYIISIIVVFLSLAALYESWTVPISILFIIPLGILGTVYATMFRGLDNDIYFIVGLLTTMGLSAKNAILIVEFAKDAIEKEGKSLIDATLEACRLRFRPILMTSFAFILGVLPLALNSGAGSASQNAVGTGVIGGMITATFLTIFYVPLFFLFITKLFTKHKNKAVLTANYTNKAEK
jgi:hydrophobe/amphiphile efflux-1 (HAE1) family protein